MKNTVVKGTLKLALLGATALTASPVLAQDGSVDERLDRLEALVAGLIERLDNQQGASQQQAAEIAAGVQAIRTESKALRAETAELKAQQTALTEKVEDQGGDGFSVGKTKISLGGYVKLDAVTQRTSGGQIGSGSIVRDFLIPGAIPVGGAASGFDTELSARQSRFLFKTDTDVGTDHTLKSVIELDFNVTSGGNERVSNSYTPRLRQAYVAYDNWLIGQAWSTFQNVGALPESLDFIGTTPGTVFNRQPLVRYTNGGLQLALEQPESTVTTATGARITAGDDQLPDAVARYNWSGDWGSFSAAGILRQLKVSDDDPGAVGDSALGYGLSLSGKLKLGERDDFRFMGTAGDGLGRYIGLNLVNGAAIRADGTLDPIFTYSGFGAYRHFWTDTVRSSIGGAYFKANNPVLLTTDQVTDESWNGFANLIWSPVGPLSFGVELMYAERSLEDGRSGNLQRLQFSTKYSF